MRNNTYSLHINVYNKEFNSVRFNKYIIQLLFTKKNPPSLSAIDRSIQTETDANLP